MRRRSPRVVWLPQTNANSLGAALTAAYQEFDVDVAGPTGSFAVGEIPLTIDAQSDPLAPESSLADIENSGYRLRRIVGKIFCRVLQRADLLSPPIVLVTAGIIVRRADESTGQSYAIQSGIAANLSPGEIANAGDPWIWRRSWVLYNLSGAAGSPILDQGPTNNYAFGTGGNADGSHVDQKTARIVSSEERLFLDVSATAIVGGTDAQTTTTVDVITDLRVLASMRTSSGNRRNASR